MDDKLENTKQTTEELVKSIRSRNNLKKIGYVILAFILLYGVIYLFTREPQMPKEYKQAIDSLTKANAVYQKKQEELSQSIDSFKSEVSKIDTDIHSIKEKTTIIKEFHHEIIQQVDHYNSTQIDSFFKARYNY